MKLLSRWCQTTKDLCDGPSCFDVQLQNAPNLTHVVGVQHHLNVFIVLHFHSREMNGVIIAHSWVAINDTDDLLLVTL